MLKRRRLEGHPSGSVGAARSVLGAVILLGGVLALSAPAGAQDAEPPENPTYCAPLRQLVDLAPEVPVSDEQYRRLAADQAALVTALRADGPADLQGAVDEFERVADRFADRVGAAGGVPALSYGDRVASTEEAFQAYVQLIDYYNGACPGALYPSSLILECNSVGGSRPPMLEVSNDSDEPVEVIAGDLTFTVPAGGFDNRSVPTDLRAEDVTIGGIDGLVRESPCDVPPAHCGPIGELIGHAATLPDDETFAAWSAEQLRLIDAVDDVNLDGLVDIGLHILEDQLAALVDAVETAGGNPADVDPATWDTLSFTYLSFIAATDDLDQCPVEPGAPSASNPSLPGSSPSSPSGSSTPSSPTEVTPTLVGPPAAPLTPKFTG